MTKTFHKGFCQAPRISRAKTMTHIIKRSDASYWAKFTKVAEKYVNGGGKAKWMEYYAYTDFDRFVELFHKFEVKNVGISCNKNHICVTGIIGNYKFTTRNDGEYRSGVEFQSNLPFTLDNIDGWTEGTVTKID